MNFLPYGEVVTGSIPLSANQFSVVRYRWSGRPLAMKLHIANKMDEADGCEASRPERCTAFESGRELNNRTLVEDQRGSLDRQDISVTTEPGISIAEPFA